MTISGVVRSVTPTRAWTAKYEIRCADPKRGASVERSGSEALRDYYLSQGINDLVRKPVYLWHLASRARAVSHSGKRPP